MERHLRSILIVLGLLLLQTTFVPLLSLGGTVPDLLLIWVVYTALRRGQVETTIAGFLVGYFYNENKIDQTLGTYRFLLVVGSCSIAHDAIYFLIFLQGTDVSPILAATQFTLATTAYTMAKRLSPEERSE